MATASGYGVAGAGAVPPVLRQPRPTRRVLLAGGALGLLALLALRLAPLVGPVDRGQAATRLQLFATIFLGIIIEALPFLLLGVLASAAIRQFVSADWLRRATPRAPLPAALLGATLGLFCLPVCECGTVPAARRLLAKGAPLPLGLAFLLAAPAVNPVVIVTTWIAFDGRPLIVFGRLGLTIAVATIVGVILGAHPQPRTLLVPPTDGHDHDDCAVGKGRLARLINHAGDEFFEMARYLVVGAAIAAAFQALVPRQALLALGQGAVVSVLVLMALAMILSICSTVDAFVALAFAGSFLPGATLAFLVFGPMIDLKSVLLFDTTFRRRTVAALVGLTAALIAAATIAINLVLA